MPSNSVDSLPISLPRPSSLFGTCLFEPLPPSNSHSESRPLIILPPLSSLPGLHPLPNGYVYPSAHEHGYPALPATPLSSSSDGLKPSVGLRLPSSSSVSTASSAINTTHTAFPPSVTSAITSSSFSASSSTSASAERVGTKRRESPLDPARRKRRDTKKSKDHDDVNVAATTLASFAQSTTTFQHTPPATPPLDTQLKQDTCQNDECVGQGSYACDHCGTTYQHVSCLQRHRWEHVEGWSEIPGRMDMTNRQQAQLLEAAQILMDIARRGMRVGIA